MPKTLAVHNRNREQSDRLQTSLRKLEAKLIQPEAYGTHQIEAQQKALDEAYRQIRLLAQAGVERLADYGVTVDPAERTYEPIIERIRAIAKGQA